MNKILKYILIFFLVFVFLLFIVRFFSHTELDDVSPEISCEEKLVEESDVLWVIPFFNNKPISENKEWCEYIVSLNKTIGLHGVYHSYQEFGMTREQNYLKNGIDEFEKCFGFKPKMFKVPQLAINKQNKNLILGTNLVLKGKINQLTKKVYHCNDTGTFPNWVIDLF